MFSVIYVQMLVRMLRYLLSWMVRILSVAEVKTMMNHIIQIAKPTMSEKWLKTWMSRPCQENDELNCSCVDNMNIVLSAHGLSSSGHHGNRSGIKYINSESFQPSSITTNGSYTGQTFNVSYTPAANASLAAGSSSGGRPNYNTCLPALERNNGRENSRYCEWRKPYRTRTYSNDSTSDDRAVKQPNTLMLVGNQWFRRTEKY